MNSNFGILFFKRLLVFIKVAFSISAKTHIKTEGGLIKLDSPMKFRLFLETMGGGFVKFGQVLLLYQEFLPPKFVFELLSMRNKAIEVPFNSMDTVFFSETGRRLNELFIEIDKKPMISTVSSQIYKGKIYDESTVTVKIQRPHVKEIFEADFGVISLLLHVISFLGFFPHDKMEDCLSDFVSWTRKSLNFIVEAKNADILCEHNKKHSGSIVPKQYLEFCTPRVIVQEYIENVISLEQVIGYGDAQQEIGNNFDSLGIVESFINDELRAYFIDGFFHANPHPSNLIFAEDYSTIHLDFGIIGEADSKRIILLNILNSLSRKDTETFCKEVFQFGDKILQNDLEQYLRADLSKRKSIEKIFEKIKEKIYEDFKKDAEVVVNDWYFSLEDADSSRDQKMIFPIFEKISLLLRNYGIFVPKEMRLFLRSLSLLDTIGLATSTKYDFSIVLNNFFSNYFPETLERYIVTGEHSNEITRKLTSLNDLDWETFRESANTEKEKIFAARERVMDLISYYSEHYEEIGSMIKKIRI